MLINGCGTRADGNVPTKDGYITTKFFHIFWIPIIPITSYEVIGDKMYPLKELYKPSYRPVVRWLWGSIVFWMLCIIVVMVAMYFDSN